MYLTGEPKNYPFYNDDIIALSAIFTITVIYRTEKSCTAQATNKGKEINQRHGTLLLNVALFLGQLLYIYSFYPEYSVRKVSTGKDFTLIKKDIWQKEKHNFSL